MAVTDLGAAKTRLICRCLVCNKPADRVRVEENQFRGGKTATVECHGKTDTVHFRGVDNPIILAFAAEKKLHDRLKHISAHKKHSHGRRSAARNGWRHGG